MKYDKFFDLAKSAGLEEAELFISESTDLSFSLFHSEVTEYESNSAKKISARGLYNGRFGSATCDSWDNKKAQYLVNEIKSNAMVSENDDPAIIFGGSSKYKKVSTYNKELENVPFSAKLEKMLELEKNIKNGDKRIIEVGEVDYVEKSMMTTIINSKGLKLNQKNNYYMVYGVAVASNGDGQVKSDMGFALGNDFNQIDPAKIAKKAVEKTVSQLGGEACESNKYKAVLAPNVVTSLLFSFIMYNLKHLKRNEHFT